MTEKNMRFQDRAVLVTGGSGIGQQICFAAAEEANSLITGKILTVDGGRTAGEKMVRHAGFESVPDQICV